MPAYADKNTSFKYNSIIIGGNTMAIIQKECTSCGQIYNYDEEDSPEWVSNYYSIECKEYEEQKQCLKKAENNKDESTNAERRRA
jgi:transcription elongation factor Elf1